MNTVCPAWRHGLLSGFMAFSLCFSFTTPLLADDQSLTPASGLLETFSNNFWQWRARYQPFSRDDIPRIEHPIGPRDWSANSIAQQKKALEKFERQWKAINATGWNVPQQVDYRLMGS